MTSLFPEGLGLSTTVAASATDYMPLYRKYRPQDLTQLVGQHAIVQTLVNAIKHNRLTHAYLFCGPRGTGKTSSARIMAKSLNCVNGPTPTPCQVCPSCTSITAGSALDVTEIDAASNNGVDSIRELSERVQFKAIDGKYRIYIIDEVHMLSSQAFNALLKTLEEPPPGVIFIFATTEPHKVLPTILSRCQRYDFSRITRENIEQQLLKVAEAEGIKITPQAITLIARNAKGGMRDALSQLDQVSVFGKEDEAISPEQVRLVSGGLTEDTLFALTQAIAEQDTIGLTQQLKSLGDHGIEPAIIAREILTHFKNILLTVAAQAQGLTDFNEMANALDVSPETAKVLKTQSQLYPAEVIHQVLQRLAQLELQLKNTPTPLLWLEVTLAGLCFRDQLFSFQQLTQRLSQLEAQIGGGAIAPPITKQILPQAQPKPVVRPTMQQPPTQQNPDSMTAAQVPEASPEQPQTVTAASSEAQQHPLDKTIEPTAPQIVPVLQANGNLSGTFQQILTYIEQAPLRALVEQQANIVEITDKELVLGFKNDSTLNIFNLPPKLKAFSDAVEKVLGGKRQLKLIVKSDITTAAAINTHTNPQPPVMQNIPAQPMVVAQPAEPNGSLSSAPLDDKDLDLMDAKRYTQELLSAKIVET